MQGSERKMSPMEHILGTNSDSWLRGRYSVSPQMPVYSKINPLDACKVLEPSRKTLNSLDAERIMNVLQDSVKAIEIVKMLPYVLESLPRFAVVLGHELLSVLENHIRLQTRYKELMNTLAKMQDEEKMSKVSNGIKNEGSSETLADYDVVQVYVQEESQRKEFLIREISFLEHSLRYSVKDILRCFKKNPKATEAVLGTKHSHVHVLALLFDTMTSLQSIVKERLLTTPLEQQEKKSYLMEVMNREMKTNAIKEKLEIKYKAAVQDKQSEIAKRNATIAELQNELHLLEHMSSEQQRRHLTDALKQTAMDTKSSQTKIYKLQAEMMEFKQKAQQDKKDHRESETYLRKRTFKMATEVYNWIQKYDADMDARQEEYDLYTRMYEADKKELSELQAHFDVLEKEYNAILEQRRLMEEETTKKMEEERICNAAAVKIQALWKGYHLRKSLRSKSKKAAKKGKKKKK